MNNTEKFSVLIGGLFGTTIGGAILAIPLWWLWNKLAPIYFYWLPKVYLAIPFWHVVGLVLLVVILQGIVRRKA